VLVYTLITDQEIIEQMHSKLKSHSQSMAYVFAIYVANIYVYDICTNRMHYTMLSLNM